jgi:uncharacterized membrane-anchored protein
MNLKKQTPIIRTAYPYLSKWEKEYIEKHEKELKEKNMTDEDSVHEIFSEIGIDVDLEEMTFTKVD